MKNLIALLILIPILSCTNKKSKKMYDNKFHQDAIFIKKLSDNLFVYNLIYSKDTLQNLTLKKLEIKQKSNRNLIQEEKLDNIEIGENDLYFSIDKDINFDGYNDICLLNFEGSYTSTFSYWIFNKSRNQFIHYKGLDEIQNPYINKEKKEICSKWRSGMSEFYLEKYFWKNDSLILKEKYEHHITDESNIKITRLINNKYVVKDSIVSENVLLNMEIWK